ncbi:MAG: LAGLIDADG homing endonuclease [Candidatus Yanofskybacteria bacterium GW2011_GWA2_41_22]|nr:MAG: LAGLIDADG homing endonuclease [Candidatus Yanofskybacteria bacterium GW2011_GWA2_41_22]KKS25069.1 MAG: LAGLIDADG homing endonuclease [Candidatus Jorgensenbacteria bacterium GW2011_GWF2_41_8]
MLTPDYIIGLTDGEGSFTVYLRNPENPIKKKRRVYAEPRFYIKLIEKDKDILYRLKKFFGCGSVYFQRDVRPNHQNCYRYEVYNRNDLKKIIIPFFKKYHLKFNSKKNDFKIFCDLFERICKNEHLNTEGLKFLCNLKAKMH